MADSEISKVILVILAIFLPPVAVFLKQGVDKHLLINILLVFLTLGLGAILHALWLILR